jgi:DNA polymerase I-like protein with 3'-5' exonuclease and polymerase domains
MKYCIFDIEADNLLDKITKTHCFSYAIYENKTLIEKNSLVLHKDIIEFIQKDYILVGHNIIRYDIPALEKILNIKILNKVYDTLAISWYQYPVKGFKHGLEFWGERLGFLKPKITDWGNQPVAVYINRCESDVEINTRLFHYQMDYAMNVYGNLDKINRVFSYLNFKMLCLKDQESIGIDLDINLIQESMLNLEFEIEEKIEELSLNMPKELGKLLKSKPKKLYKIDGTLSNYGEKWFDYLKENNLPKETEEVRERPNPGSHKQLQTWLFSLNWQPQTFKISKSTGENLPQVSLPFGGGLCQSVKYLFEDYPYLESLEGLYKAKHRYGLFKSYIENKDENNKVYASAQGFTNTIRLKHKKPISNLPKVNTYYGEQIRGALIVPDDSYIMCGSDVSGLEDNTKQHFIYFYDPDYVNAMRVPGFDPHIDIAVLAGMLTKDDEVFFKWCESKDKTYIFTSDEQGRLKIIKVVRNKAKVVNFSATYGAGPAKIALTLKCDIAFATILHKTYWERNKAVKQTAKDTKVIIVDSKNWVQKLVLDFVDEKGNKVYKKEYVVINQKQKWLYNPVSGFYYFLKADKDKFSTLNQSAGVYFFDTWVRNVKNKLDTNYMNILLQYHDEILLLCKKDKKEKMEKILEKSIIETNEQIKLNVEINISMDWGLNYADCH